MRLSSNFSRKEFTHSAGTVIVPTKEQLYCLKLLCRNILQPIRDKFGQVTITSGLRTKETTNKLIAVGLPASLSSDHIAWSDGNIRGTGAADFTCHGKDIEVIFNWIQRNLMHNIGQVIYYPDRSFIHVSNRFSKIFCMPDSRAETRRRMIYTNGVFTPIET
jgi:hypothetical protein